MLVMRVLWFVLDYTYRSTNRGGQLVKLGARILGLMLKIGKFIGISCTHHILAKPPGDLIRMASLCIHRS